LEQEHLDESGRPKMAKRRKVRVGGDLQLTLFGPVDHPLLKDIRDIDLNNLTPLAAMNLVKQWQEKLGKEKSE